MKMRKKLLNQKEVGVFDLLSKLNCNIIQNIYHIDIDLIFEGQSK